MRAFMHSVVSFSVLLVACSGRLVALSTIDGGSGDGMSSGTSSRPRNPGCAIPLFARSCTTENCHGALTPVFTDFVLTAEAIAAAHDGADFVGRKADDVADPENGLCGASAVPPVLGKFIVDPINPEASLLYNKLSVSPVCGSHMPVIGKPSALSATEQQCVLDWIKALPGVTAQGGTDGSTGGQGGSGGIGLPMGPIDAGTRDSGPNETGLDSGTPAAKCAIAVLVRSCASMANCHSKETPFPEDLDLTSEGIAAAMNGAAFVGKRASDALGALCGLAAVPPVTGKLLVDPLNSRASLLYEKLARTPSCGSHMPVVGRPAELSAAEQKCILDWIEQLPGVSAGDGG